MVIVIVYFLVNLLVMDMAILFVNLICGFAVTKGRVYSRKSFL